MILQYYIVKTLCLLVETAKHVDVTSYERLYEVCFGRPGYFFISLSMFVMSYGAMVSYLMIIKQTLPSLIGLTDSPPMVLFVSSLCIILPLSSLRVSELISLFHHHEPKSSLMVLTKTSLNKFFPCIFLFKW